MKEKEKPQEAPARTLEALESNIVLPDINNICIGAEDRQKQLFNFQDVPDTIPGTYPGKRAQKLRR